MASSSQSAAAQVWPRIVVMPVGAAAAPQKADGAALAVAVLIGMTAYDEAACVCEPAGAKMPMHYLPSPPSLRASSVPISTPQAISETTKAH